MSIHRRLGFSLTILIVAGLACDGVIAQAGTLRAGAEPDYPPLSFVNQAGQPDGFAIAVLRAASEVAGEQVAFETGLWTDLRQQLADGRLDVLPLVGRTPEREALYDFTIPYLTLYGALFVRKGASAPRSFDELAQHTVAVMAGDNAVEFLLRRGLAGGAIATPTFADAFRRLSTGGVDVVVAQKLMGVTLLRELGITNVMVTGRQADDFRQDFCFAVRKGDTRLLNRLNEGLYRLSSQGLLRRLQYQWLVTGERDQILARPLLYGGDSKCGPFEFINDDGQPDGFNIELIRAIARQLGMDLRIELTPWAQVPGRLKRGECDVTSMLFSTERDTAFDFTTPHSIVFQAVFGRADGPTYPGFQGLSRQRVAVQDRDIMHEYALKQGIGAGLLVTDAPETSLAMVSQGEADFALVSHLQGGYLAQRHRWRNLVTVDKQILETEYCFAVRKGDAELIELLNDGLLQIKASGEYRRIRDRWLGVLDRTSPWQRLRKPLMIALGLLLALGILAGVTIYSLRRAIKTRTRDLEHANRTLIAARRAALNIMEDEMAARKQLQASQRQLQLTQFAMDHAADPAYWADAAGRIVYANETACRNLGYARAEFLQLMATDFHPRLPPQTWGHFWEDLKNRGSWVFETTHRRKDGSTYAAEIHASFVVFEGCEYVCAFAQDISIRRRAEQALRDSEERYRLLAENVSDVIWTMTLDGRFTYISPAIEKLRGYTVEEALKQPFNETIAPEFTATVEDGLRFCAEAMRSGQRVPDTRGEFELLRKDGSRVWCEINTTGMYDAQGLFIAILGVTRDISARKQADDERDKLQTQLMHAQRMESVGRLAGGVAHDFNNKLTAILGNAEMCLDEIPAQHPLREYLDEIILSARQSAALTRQLLAYARKQVIKPERLDLNDTVSNTLKMLRRLIGEDIELGWKPAANPATILMDPTQLDQILANLAVNARDAIAGAGRLTIETANTTLDPDACAAYPDSTPGAYVRLSVSDTGCGMDDYVLSHIFEPFFTTKPTGHGTGLGMATVYGIVRQNNGFIHVASRPGEGTVFHVYLPAMEHTPATRDARHGNDLPQGHGETILLVEDEAPALRVTELLLTRLNYKVISAGSPEDALRLAGEAAAPIALLLTDIVMPKLNGRELAERLRATQPHLRCLYMSGYTADVIAQKGILDQDTHFIAKPFSRTELALKIRETLA